jgi:hypothetical protein
MRCMVVLFLLFLAACSSEQRMLDQTKATGVSYDTIKDPKVAGRYEARMSLDPKKTVDVADAGIQALVNGLEAAQKDGYDLATYSGPHRGKLTQTRTSQFSSTVEAQFPGMVYYVQGYKSGSTPPPSANARSIATALSVLETEREKRRAGRKAVTDAVTSTQKQ